MYCKYVAKSKSHTLEVILIKINWNTPWDILQSATCKLLLCPSASDKTQFIIFKTALLLYWEDRSLIKLVDKDVVRELLHWAAGGSGVELKQPQHVLKSLIPQSFSGTEQHRGLKKFQKCVIKKLLIVKVLIRAVFSKQSSKNPEPHRLCCFLFEQKPQKAVTSL